jgi:hypothetical protein
MGPQTNIGATALGGSLGTILVWILTLSGLAVPDTVGAAIATFCAVVLGWIVPPSLWAKEGV